MKDYRPRPGRRQAAFLMLLARPNPCPSGPLRCRYLFPRCSRHRSLLTGRCRSTNVDLPERLERRCHGVQFVRKSHTFLLELNSHGPHQCFGHVGMVSVTTAPVPVRAPASAVMDNLSAPLRRAHASLVTPTTSHKVPTWRPKEQDSCALRSEGHGRQRRRMIIKARMVHVRPHRKKSGTAGRNY